MKNKLAIVTGASSGLGKAYACALARLGWDLLLTGRREKRLSNLKADLEEKNGVNVDIAIVDFNNQSQFKALLERISEYSNVDLLVNNAGYGCRDGFFEGSYSIQENMLNVHVTAAAHLVHAVVPKMLEKNSGSIVNVSSLSAFIPAPLNYFYCSSKLFMVSFSECLHVDLIDSNIKVQALCPGFVQSDFHSRIGQENKVETKWDKMLWMKPEEVVSCSLRSLASHKVICVPGWINRIIYILSNFLPKQLCYWATVKKVKRNLQPKVCVV